MNDLRISPLQLRARWLATAVALILLLTAVTACQNGNDPPTSEPATSQPIAPHTLTPTANLAPPLVESVISTEPYPAPAAEPSSAPQAGYPGPTPPTGEQDELLFIPQITIAELTAVPTAVSPPSPTPIPTLDVAALRAQLTANGQDLAFVKIGFHVTLLPDKTILENWKRELDAAGIPIFLKSVDNAEPLYNVQNMMRESGVPHILVFRASGGVPNYDLPAVEAARQHWAMHKALFPPELDPELVWVETINELDKNRSEWIAEFALETARLTLADGFRWAAFGWAAGEPEPEDWQLPAMLEFLRLAGENPDRLAIALHEGSAVVSDPTFEYPYRTGRFMQLFDIADQYGIPRPTVLITEWGWKYDEIPTTVEEAMDHIAWIAQLYAPFPEVKGAAIWMLGLGCCFGEISEQVEDLIDPLTQYTLTHYFTAPLPPDKTPTDPALYLP